jgi:hypothetical protein
MIAALKQVEAGRAVEEVAQQFAVVQECWSELRDTCADGNAPF